MLMIWPVAIAIIGIVFLVLGALSVLAALMPRFGGTSDDGALPVGAVLILAGGSMLFYAGTLA